MSDVAPMSGSQIVESLVGEVITRRVVTLEQVIAAEDLDREWVSIPEWAPKGAENPGEYGAYVRSLTGAERANWQQASIQMQGKNTTIKFRESVMLLVLASCCDESGKRLFPDSSGRELLKKNSKVLQRLADKASDLSGIGEDEMESLTGNSSASLDDDSLTD